MPKHERTRIGRRELLKTSAALLGGAVLGARAKAAPEPPFQNVNTNSSPSTLKITDLMFSEERYPVNLGNPCEMTILEFAERIRGLTGSRPEIVFQPLPEDDPKQRRPDIGKARALLGWEPRVTLETGLAQTVEYFRGLHAVVA